MTSQTAQPTSHQPVLLTEVYRLFCPSPGQKYLDLTTGPGGHARVITSVTGLSQATLVDRDPSLGLETVFPGATVIYGDFATVASQLPTETYDLILADLGLSSRQLDDPRRGFGFLTKGPLDMRLDQTSGQPLAALLRQTDQRQLADILRLVEPRAAKVAAAIKRARPETTTALAALVEKAVPRTGPRHSATRTFLALRLWVNDELGQLQRLLEIVPRLLAPKGRLGIISFHSLEDRLVKQSLTNLGHSGYDSQYNLLTKRPLTPSKADIDLNPRSRSAKLRGLERR